MMAGAVGARPRRYRGRGAMPLAKAVSLIAIQGGLHGA